jgi:thiamine-phosphate pyrophosphorylase
MNLPVLHVLVPDEAARRDDFLEIAAGMRRDLGDRLALHLRRRAATTAEQYELASRLAAEGARHGGWCVVNRRLDIALAAGCQAVQLGRGALPISAAVGVAAGTCAVGASVHGVPEAARAAREGANYLVVGTVYPSESHARRPGAGPELVRACAELGVPVVAIGGITARTAAEVVAQGAAGVAVISAVWGDSDPRGAAMRLSDVLETAPGGS